MFIEKLRSGKTNCNFRSITLIIFSIKTEFLFPLYAMNTIMLNKLISNLYINMFILINIVISIYMIREKKKKII